MGIDGVVDDVHEHGTHGGREGHGGGERTVDPRKQAPRANPLPRVCPSCIKNSPINEMNFSTIHDKNRNFNPLKIQP